MIVLGIDPGLERTGWALIQIYPKKIIRAGLIFTHKELPISYRLFQLQEQIEIIITQNLVKRMAIEKIIPTTRIHANLEKILQARGCILAIAGKYQIPIKEYTPPQIKKAVTGTGKSKKSDIIHTIEKIYKFERKNGFTDDVYDAIAAGLTYEEIKL